ncbi:amidase family protein [Qipengyuania spongiae]|uniref:Amidase family protein n=1 Tax=Qipengyuania spongiae TaxID=2909673 RepID=A0ABY5SZD9_9SPHN|nr:amidase family protein [Qipengyuania spongiae]UVI38589.1 amidase family protein [Qipengyuania spongiae]
MSYPTLTDKPGAVATAAAIRAGDLSLQEAVELAIARIERLDAHVNAVVVRDFDRARETAKAMNGTMPLDEQPLSGLSMTFKGSFDVAGPSTSWGHERFARQIAAPNAEAVRRRKWADLDCIAASWASAEILHG